jgi:hypothetical protein
MSLQLVSLPPGSAEFGRIEYELQLQFSAPGLHIKECFELSNATLTAKFLAHSRTFSPVNIVFAYISTQSLQRSLSDITQKGIKVDAKRGFRFSTKCVDVDRSKDVIEVIRLAVALGNPQNHQSTSISILDSTATFLEDAPVASDLKPGYNSLCLSADGDFIVFKSPQIRTCHLVRFGGGAELDSADDADNLCDLCNNEIATVWCLNDEAKLCRSCDADSHRTNRIVAKHKRIPLSEAKALMETCPAHSQMRAEYYCPQCQLPVCMTCKMTGSHSRGDAASHALVTVAQAYQEALQASGRDDSTVVRRLRAIDDRIRAFDERLNSVLTNGRDVEEEIMSIARAAIERAKMIASERALALRSAQTELARKRNETERLGQFLARHRDSIGPLAFLRAFDRYVLIVQQFQGTADLSGNVPIDTDLRVVGELEISSTQREPNRTPSRRERIPEPETMDSDSIRAADVSTEYKTLSQLAKQRSRRYRSGGADLPCGPFEGSAIMLSPEKALSLYLCFPFKSPPRTHLLFSTERDGRSIATMHQMIDGVGITVVLIKVESHVFGGFAAVKWVSDGRPFGENSSSFLFSITRDAFVPYQPRVADPCCLYATPDTLTFGKYDLRLAGDFDECSAVIENSYGIGFDQGSADAKMFMAGTPSFAAEIVEVWGFFNLDS